MNAIARILESSLPKVAPRAIERAVEPDPVLSVLSFLPPLPPTPVAPAAPSPAPAAPVVASTPKATLELVSNFRHQLRIQKNGIVDLEETRLFYRGSYLYGRQSVIGKGGIPVDMIVDIPSDVAIGESVCGFARTADSGRGRVLDKIEGQVQVDAQGRKIFAGHIFVDTAIMSSSGCTVKKYALHMLLKTSTTTGTRWLTKRSGMSTLAESTWQLTRC